MTGHSGRVPIIEYTSLLSLKVQKKFYGTASAIPRVPRSASPR